VRGGRPRRQRCRTTFTNSQRSVDAAHSVTVRPTRPELAAAAERGRSRVIVSVVFTTSYRSWFDVSAEFSGGAGGVVT
jgi:hypothetical protein